MRLLLSFFILLAVTSFSGTGIAQPVSFSFLAGSEEKPQVVTIKPYADLKGVTVMIDGAAAHFEGQILFFQMPSGGDHENKGLLEKFAKAGVALERGAWSNTFVLFLNGRIIYFNGAEFLTFQIPKIAEADLEEALFEFYHDPQQRFELINVSSPNLSKVFALQKNRLWESLGVVGSSGRSVEHANFEKGKVVIPQLSTEITMEEVFSNSVVRFGAAPAEKPAPSATKKSPAVAQALRVLSGVRINVDRQPMPLADFLKNEYEILEGPIANRMDYQAFDKEIQMAQAALSMSYGGGVRVTGRAGTGKSYFLDTYLSYLMENETEPFLAIRIAATALVGGDGYVGVIERKIQALKSAARHVKIVLFIDEIHTLVGAGRYKGNSIDFFQHIKSELAAGQIKIVGTTTDQEWEQNFSSDKALTERFPINIKMSEPAESKVIQILQTFVGREGKTRQVKADEAVLKRIFHLANRFDPVGGNPRKSVRLLDFSLSMAKAKKKFTMTESDLTDYAGLLYDYDLKQLEPESIRQKLLGLGAYLDQNLIGMKSTKAGIEKALGAHFFDQFDHAVSSRPFGMLLYGKRGVGKTALATHLAKGLGFGFTKIMMADYASPMAVEGFKTRLALAVKTNPFSVVLLDEIEKAHPDIQRALLQVMDEGRFEAKLSESYSPQAGGHTEVDASKTLFVYTTNAAQSLANTKVSEVKFQEVAEQEGLNSYLLDRIGEFISIANPTVQDIKDIVALKWSQYKTGLTRKGRTLVGEDKLVIDTIVEQAIAQEVARNAPPEFGFSSGKPKDTDTVNVQLSVRELERRVTDISQEIAQYFVRNPDSKEVQLSLQDGQLVAGTAATTKGACETALSMKETEEPKN